MINRDSEYAVNLKDLRENILQLKYKLETEKLSDMDRKIIEIEMGDLVDEFKRRTFHISTMEDNYLS